MSLYFFFRPLPNGNCLHSSASICLFGHNNHLNELCWLTSIESYDNAKFHCQHPVLLECFESSFKVFIQISIVYFLAAYPREVSTHSFYRYCQICKGRGNLQFKKWSKLFFFYLYWLYQLLKVHKLIAVIQVLDRKSVDCYLMFIHPSHLHKK